MPGRGLQLGLRQDLGRRFGSSKAHARAYVLRLLIDCRCERGIIGRARVAPSAGVFGAADEEVHSAPRGAWAQPTFLYGRHVE